jgi:hypothetical protein
MHLKKWFIIPSAVGLLSVIAISYGMSTPRYALFKLGKAIDAKNLQQVESLIDIKAISKDLVEGVVAEINLEATQKISSGNATGFEVLGLNAGLNALNNMKPALEALYTKKGQDLLETDLGKFSGSAAWFLISQRITQTGDTAVLVLDVPQNKMDLGVSQLEIELSKVPGTGWKIVGISNQTIHALYEKRQLSYSTPYATSNNSSENFVASAPSPQVIAPSAPTSSDSESIDNSVTPSTVKYSPEVATSNKFSFPKASCGGKPTGGNDTWYPVFVDGGDLDTIRQQFCADAVATVRKDTKVPTVQLASFVSRDQAVEFANAVGGDVGQPTFPDEPQP